METLNLDQFILIQQQKKVINHKFSLENAFQEIFYRVDNWINEGSGWIVEFIESQYIDLSTYRPLSGSFYIKLLVELKSSGSFYKQLLAELKSPKEGPIDIKDNGRKCFLWCRVRHINPIKIHPERITKEDKKLVKELDYDDAVLNFLSKKNILARLKKRTTFGLACFVMKTN